MKIQNIYRSVLANTNETIKAQFVKGHINGLLLSYDYSGILNAGSNDQDITHNAVLGSYVKVKFVSDKVETLLPSIPLIHLRDLCNLKLGSTGYAGINDISNPPETFQVYVDLGSIFVDGGDEVHIEIVNSTAHSQTVPMTINAISRENEPFHFLKYDIDSDRNELHQNVTESYLCTSETFGAGTDVANIDVDVYADSAQYDTDLQSIISSTSMFNRIERENISQTLPLFVGLNNLPEDVLVKFQPLDSTASAIISNFYVLNIRMDSTWKGFEKNERANTQVTRKVISKLEVSKPTLANILQVKGLPKSNEIED